MYIDFEDYRPETPRVEPAISSREAVLISLFLHALILLAIIFAPLLPADQATERAAQLAARRQAAQDNPRFVFVQPRIDRPAPQPPERADASDRDRMARSTVVPPDPRNALPFARGNSPERVEADPGEPAEPVRDLAEGIRSSPAPEVDSGADNPAKSVLQLPERLAARPALALGRGAAAGPLGDALRNLQRYVQRESFDNAQGGSDAQGSIQFDTKGVEFGPWIRRFVAQVKRNWFIPYAVWGMRGHVVITFNVHKDGALTDVDVKLPAAIGAFNNAAVNALIASNPTQPLPEEYPADRAFFTVTFFYNETPPPE